MAAHRPGMLIVGDLDPYVIEVLEARDVDMESAGGHGGEWYAPAWAVAVARAEAFDRFDPRGRKAFKWAAIWRLASKDVEWQRATAMLATPDREADGQNKFLAMWIDTWLFKSQHVRCYPPEMTEGAALRRVDVR